MCQGCKEDVSVIKAAIGDVIIYLCDSCRESLICGLDASECGDYDD